jgi:heat-inducible transcriptional repressor
MEELDPRQREILKAIVQEHLTTGEPVGSSAIAGDLAVSSATVRGVMADLEELGLLEKPHTSAGRIPTDRGYRYFVDTLVQIHPPPRPERELIERALPQEATTDELLRETTRLLSNLSRYAAVVTAPGLAQVPLKRIEFVRLKQNRVLAILVAASGLVRNRLLTLDFPMTAEELTRAAAYLNGILADTPLEVVRERLTAEKAREQIEYDALAAKALALGLRVVDAAGGEGNEVLIEGEKSFLEAPEFADLKRMRELFAALEEKSKLLAVLDRTLNARELRIFIGSETEFSARTGASVVAAPYATQTGVVGSIGVIGPTRMDYSRAIALVDYTARALSRLLGGRQA